MGGIIMSKSLVAYFSASGVTENLAKRIAKRAGADLFAIKPEVPYSNDDVNWRNPLSRCNKEKLGKKDVPLAERVENIDEYEKIYLGFPIWYWNAPNIVITFLKEHNMANKVIVLFATSGGSDLGKTSKTIANYVDSTAVIKDGLLINDLNEDKINQLLNL